MGYLLELRGLPVLWMLQYNTLFSTLPAMHVPLHTCRGSLL